MKNSIILFMMFFFFSCKESKPEFVQSKVYKKLFLLNNPLLYNSYKNKNNYCRIKFYKYTMDMSYFLENEEYDGFGAKVLSVHNDDVLGAFIISKCKKDSTKLVGRFHFYGLKGLDGGKKEIDTLIYKCK